MSRFYTHGRDPWTPRQARHHRPDINGALQPMDYPREPVSPIVWLFLAAVAVPFAASFLGAIA